MRGLIMKDAYVLIKQMKIFAVLMLILAVIPNTFTRGFAIMYASMLPITALSFDEQAKWDYYAAMMPYRKKDLALSKYMVGLLFTLIVVVVGVLSVLVTAAVKNQPPELMKMYLQGVLILTSAAVILMAINLPIIFKMGAERGRLVYMAITVLVAVTVVGSVEMNGSFWNLDENLLLLLFIAAAVVSLLISMVVSVKVYNSKRY